MPKFVVLRHDVGEEFAAGSSRGSSHSAETHFDWMFQVDAALRTWATEPVESLLQDLHVAATRIADHRLKYLEFEGDIGGHRGSVVAIVRGEYSLIHSDDERFSAIATWQDDEGNTHDRPLEFYRSSSRGDSSDDSRVFWRLRLG